MSPLAVESVLACACGSRDLAAASRPFRLAGQGFGLRRCNRCGRMLLDPRIPLEGLSAFYGDEYYGAGSRKFVPAIEGVVDWFRDRRARLANRLLRAASPEGTRRVLDIGCGSGQFLAQVARWGHECHGTELSAETARRASRVPGLRLHLGTLEDDTFEAASFDLISIWHVLEHLPDPDRVLRMCHRWLRGDGALLIAVPNIDSWQARLFDGAWFHIDPPRHLHHFGPASLQKTLRDSGFRMERLRTLSWEQNLYGILQSSLNAVGFPRDEFYETLKGNRSISRSPGLALQALLMSALLPLALVLTVAEALFRNGGTLECIARRTEPPRA